jgi:hypothetical protein
MKFVVNWSIDQENWLPILEKVVVDDGRRTGGRRARRHDRRPLA